MRILFLSDVPLRNPSSGSEQVLCQQAFGLSRAGDDIFAITRFNGKGRPYYNFDGGVKEGVYFANPENVPQFVFSIFRYPYRFFTKYCNSKQFDAVICHQPFTSITLVFRKHFRRSDIIYVFHSPSHDEYLLKNYDIPRWKKGIQVYIRKWIERICVKKAKKIMVLSRFMANQLQRIHHVSSDKIIINPGGVDLERFYPHYRRDQLKDRLKYPPGKIHLLTVRNLDPRMGLDNLIRAAVILKKENLACHLTIGGEGPEKAELKRLVDTLSIDEDVRFSGFIPAKDLNNYYSAADFFILPTKELEGFGLVTPESMACGTPVLGTPVGGTREILSNFKPSFLFNGTSPEDIASGIKYAIKKYYYQPSLYSSLRKQCREYVANHFSWNRHNTELKKLLQETAVNRYEVNPN